MTLDAVNRKSINVFGDKGVGKTFVVKWVCKNIAQRHGSKFQAMLRFNLKKFPQKVNFEDLIRYIQ